MFTYEVVWHTRKSRSINYKMEVSAMSMAAALQLVTFHGINTDQVIAIYQKGALNEKYHDVFREGRGRVQTYTPPLHARLAAGDRDWET